MHKYWLNAPKYMTMKCLYFALLLVPNLSGHKLCSSCCLHNLINFLPDSDSGWTLVLKLVLFVFTNPPIRFKQERLCYNFIYSIDML